MNARHKALAVRPLDRRILPTLVLFGAAALIWLAGIGVAKAAVSAAAPARSAAEMGATASVSLAQLIALHRQVAGLPGGQAPALRSPTPCCGAGGESK